MKGIAIPYIIAIILGIAVVVAIGAIFFGSSGDLQSNACNSKLSAFCTVWRGTGYGAQPSGGWDKYASECIKLQVKSPSESKCNEILGRGATIGKGTDDGKGLFIECNPRIQPSECKAGFTCKEAEELGKFICQP